MESQYPSHVTGITAQANLPCTNIGVNDLCHNNKNGQTLDLQRILTLSSMSKKHQFSAQELVYYHNTTLKP
jgi:hypothetical protein